MAREKKNSEVFAEMLEAVQEFTDIGTELAHMILIIQMFMDEKGLINEFKKWLTDNKQRIQEGLKDGS